MITGRWVHAHEEDAGGAQVFRPAGHPLPPARGRTALELRPDGTYLEHAPGPDDRPEATTGRWSLTGDRLVLGAAADGRGERSWTVASAGPERLVLRT